MRTVARAGPFLGPCPPRAGTVGVAPATLTCIPSPSCLSQEFPCDAGRGPAGDVAVHLCGGARPGMS
eukprot:3174811-Lingulodinium_polyedra.AAC.1